MNKTVVTSIFALVLVGEIIIFVNMKPSSNSNTNIASVLETQRKWESKIDEQALVIVTVTPFDMPQDSNEWKFDVVMDTHSVELDQNLIKSTVLVDDQGKEYKPLKWEGTVGGHHREGVLIFNSIIPTPKSVELKISDIGGVIRSFMWQF